MAVKRPVSPLAFLIATSVLLCIVVAVQRPLPERDLFALIPEDGYARFGPMTAAEMYAAKLAHGRSNPRYSVGVFGNSRSMMLRARHLGLDSGSLFNFSIGGQSLRTSVVMLEKLAAEGKAPKTALVSFDHAELEFYQNPDLRGVALRSRLAWRDIALALQSDPPALRQWIRMGWRHIYSAYNGLSEYLDTEQLILGLRWRLRGLVDKNPWRYGLRLDAASGYRRDGSSGALPTQGPRSMALLPRATPAILSRYLAYDLRRLAALRRAGIRVVVYESPLEPGNARHFAAKPSPHARTIRETMRAVCAKTGLECYLFRPAALTSTAARWPNADHAPASVLGVYLRRLVWPAGGSRKK